MEFTQSRWTIEGRSPIQKGGRRRPADDRAGVTQPGQPQEPEEVRELDGDAKLSEVSSVIRGTLNG
jgi:hypothetical protein